MEKGYENGNKWEKPGGRRLEIGNRECTEHGREGNRIMGKSGNSEPSCLGKYRGEKEAKQKAKRNNKGNDKLRGTKRNGRAS